MRYGRKRECNPNQRDDYFFGLHPFEESFSPQTHALLLLGDGYSTTHPLGLLVFYPASSEVRRHLSLYPAYPARSDALSKGYENKFMHNRYPLCVRASFPS